MDLVHPVAAPMVISRQSGISEAMSCRRPWGMVDSGPPAIISVGATISPRPTAHSGSGSDTWTPMGETAAQS